MSKEEYIILFEKYINKQASKEEIKELVWLVDNDPEINDWLEKQIANSPKGIDSKIKQEMLSNIHRSINFPDKKKKLTLLPGLFRVAAVLLLAILCGSVFFMLNQQNNLANPLVVVAEPGQKTNIILPDGSKVAMNSDSRLKYYNDYSNKKRYLELDGEAYFEVQPNSEKPFIVKSLEVEVEVLGTSFDVKAYSKDDYVSVVLNTGKIQVTTPNDQLLLKKNERITYDRKSRNIKKETVNALDYIDWRFNRLRFENESLSNIVTTISRIHNVTITFGDKHIEDLKFTGTLDNRNIETVLSTITLTSPIKYNIVDSTIVLFENKNSKIHYNEEHLNN